MLDFCVGHLIPVASDESRNENEERSKSPTVEIIDETLPTTTADEISEQTQQGQKSIGITFLFCYDYVYIHVHMSLCLPAIYFALTIVSYILTQE